MQYHFRKEVMMFFTQKYEVFCASPYDVIYTPKLKELGIKTIDVSFSSKSVGVLPQLKILWNFIGVIYTVKPALIITYTIKPNIYVALLNGFFRRKLVVVFTGLGSPFIKERLITKIIRILFHVLSFNITKAVVLNQDDYEEIGKSSRRLQEKTVVLSGEGINLNHFTFNDGKNRAGLPFTFLFIGRLLADKGVREMIEAIKILRARQKPLLFEVQVIGAADADNPSALSLDEIIGYHKEGVINYIGTADDVRMVISESDCLVLPSYREGVPRVLMEGAAMGKPLIATKVAGCRDVVKHTLNGLLCDSQNPQKLADAMEQMINFSQEERLRMGRSGRQLMEDQFSINIVLRQYETILALL